MFRKITALTLTGLSLIFSSQVLAQTSTPAPATTAAPAVVAQAAPASTPAPAETSDASYKSLRGLGLSVLGTYEISTYDSLYSSFGISSIKAAGFGFGGFIEKGLADRITLTLDAEYSRLTYSNKSFSAIKKNYGLVDAVGNYYFTDNTKAFKPYGSVGLGAEVSSSGVAPLFDLGAGGRYAISKDFSIRTQLMYKTAVIHHRIEGSVGFIYTF